MPSRIDDSARGFLETAPDPLRYSAADRTPYETTGMLCDRIPRGSRVLDVGCGTGSITELIAQECEATVVGLEPDPERAEATRARGLEVKAGYLGDLSVEDLGTFDVIVLADVLEHLDDSVSLLENTATYLNPGGLIIASIPNVANWTVRLALLRGRFDYATHGIMDATHVRWFTGRTVDQVFAAAGFDVLERDMTNGVWLPQLTRIKGYGRIPEKLRVSALRSLVRLRPELFGCQHIVVATPTSDPEARTPYASPEVSTH